MITSTSKKTSGLSETEQLEKVKENCYNIQYIKDPTEAAQLAAVKMYAFVIKYIKDPTEVVQLAAVKACPSYIVYIECPTEVVQMIAIRQIPTAMFDLKFPSFKIGVVYYLHKFYVKFPSAILNIPDEDREKIEAMNLQRFDIETKAGQLDFVHEFPDLQDCILDKNL